MLDYPQYPSYDTSRLSVPSPSHGRGTRRRRGWATVALILSLLAILVEAKFHLCASELFDPLPDVITGIAYAWVLFMLCFNEVTLSAATHPAQNPLILWLGLRRSAGLALAGTGVGLLVAAMVTWMFLPFLLAAPLLIITVIGTLLLSPALDLIVLIAQLRALRALYRHESGAAEGGRLTVGASLLGAAALFTLIVRPVFIGRYTDAALHTTGTAQQRAFAALRLLHGESTMLDLTYQRNPAYWVCWGYKAGESGLWPWVGYGWEGLGEDVPKARRTYFLLTGVPFESVPRPESEERQNPLDQPDDVAIEETGGYVVGRPVPNLSLDASDMDFTVDAQTETTVGAWTMTFRNSGDAPAEARADILLPPGATCHAVSLWVNGVERPAAFSSPQKVRTAYQQIAVVQRRDPLLVTMPAPDHLLAQCFPVPPRATMKIKLGITAPLQWRSEGRAKASSPYLYWICPTFGPVNFAVPPRLTHTLALRSAAGVPLAAPDLRGADIFSPPTVSVPTARTAPRSQDILDTGVMRFRDPLAFPAVPVDLYLLRDASRGMNDLMTPALQAELMRVVAMLPPGSRVVTEDTLSIDAADDGGASPADASYVGGTDPAPALERMLRRAREAQTPKRPAVVVFLHAASPANVSDLSGVRRELQRGIAEGGPALVSIQLAQEAPDAVAMDLTGFPSVYARRALPSDDGALTDALRFATQAASFHHLPSTGTFSARDAFSLGGHTPAINGDRFLFFSDNPSEADPWERLRRASSVTADWYRANLTANINQSVDLRIAAGAPAARAHLVTPLSSAVVLETEEEYEDNGLKDPNQKKDKQADKKAAEEVNVNAPEPPAGLLAAVGLCFLLGFRPIVSRSSLKARRE